MWWLTLKKWLKISAVWCRQHWRWLVIGGFALVMYYLGRKASKAQLIQAKLALKSLLLEAEREAFAKEVEDRKSARDMYKDDAIIQKVLATLFTVAYFGITFVMFNYFVTKSIELGEFEISFISTIFGAMSAKVNTIIDFFFGGSSKKNEQSKEK